MAERKVLLLRLRPALHEALRRWATDEFRSVNAQLEYIVHEALREAGRLPRQQSSRADEDEDEDEDLDEREGSGDDEDPSPGRRRA